MSAYESHIFCRFSRFITFKRLFSRIDICDYHDIVKFIYPPCQRNIKIIGEAYVVAKIQLITILNHRSRLICAYQFAVVFFLYSFVDHHFLHTFYYVKHSNK